MKIENKQGKRECFSKIGQGSWKALCFKTMSLVWSSPVWQAHGPAFSFVSFFLIPSIWPPHSFIHPPCWIEHSWRVAVAAVLVHATPSVSLPGKTGIDQRSTRGGTSAGGQHPGGWAIPPRHHRELVGARGGSIVEIGGAAALEWSTLALSGAWVWRGQVCVVMGTAQRHACGDRGGRVGKRCRVVHPWAGESALGQGGESRELALKLPRERSQICGTCTQKMHSSLHTQCLGLHFMYL